MNKKMIVFDVDGVLLDNKMGGFKDILVLLGKEEEVKKINEEYQKRKHKGPWGLKQLTELYQGFLEDRLKKIAIKYCKENLAEGARECLEEIKSKGCILGALSSNPQFIMDVLAEILPLYFSEGTQLEIKDGRATGKIQKQVDRYGKAEILQRKTKNYRLNRKDVVVVGDSITDLPMAEIAGTFIAFCSKEAIVKEKADLIMNNFHSLTKKVKRGLLWKR